MPSWIRGGPRKLYVAIHNESGEITIFLRRRDRYEWLLKQPLISALRGRGVYTFLTYVQQSPGDSAR